MRADVGESGVLLGAAETGTDTGSLGEIPVGRANPGAISLNFPLSVVIVRDGES